MSAKSLKTALTPSTSPLKIKDEVPESGDIQFGTRITYQIFNDTVFKVHRTPEGKAVFLASEIAEFLGYANPDQAIHQHCKEIGKIVQKDGKQTRHLLAIGEPDLFRLIIKSTKPDAQEFEKWVFNEVLPSIRQTGKYKITRKLNPPPEGQAIIDAANAAKAARMAQMDFFPNKVKVVFSEPVAAQLGAERKRLLETGIELPAEVDLISYIVTKYFEELV